MGLEITEIIMDIESEFCISIPSNVQMDGFVYELEEIAVKLHSPNRILALIKAIPANGPHGYIESGVYYALWKENPFLPSPTGFLGAAKRHSSEEIKNELSSKTLYYDESKIRAQLRFIIKDRSGYKGDIQSHHHLVRDLGCG
jgi:hypothetical protein